MLDDLKKRLDRLRPLSQNTLRSLHDQLVVEWTYHSNAIEGNTLTLKETKVVLEGITIGGKTMREHFEIINHREAIEYIESVTGIDLTEHTIRSVHQLVLKGIDPQAGQYRQENVLISGASHVPPDHFDVSYLMAQMLEDYRELEGVERAARLHAEFVKIHPFVDGNGRTARLLMNLELMRAGHLPVIIRTESRLAYYEALDKAHTGGGYGDFIALVESELVRAYENVLRLVERRD